MERIRSYDTDLSAKISTILSIIKKKNYSEVLAPFHLLLGSTSWYLPALAYASDRHVTDVISVMSHQPCVMSAVCLSLKLYI